MVQRPLGNYLKTYRRKAGLNQYQLARLLGHGNRGLVARHERGSAIPSFETALRYQAIFRVPISILFVGIYQSIEHEVETRLGEMEAALQEKSTRGRNARTIAQILEWTCERRMGVDFSTDS